MPRDGDEERYERAAVRWAGRFALEARTVTLEAVATAVAVELTHEIDAPKRRHRSGQVTPPACSGLQM